MNRNRWFYLGVAAILVLMMSVTVVYAQPAGPNPWRGGDGEKIELRGGKGNGNGSGRQHRHRHRRGSRGGRSGMINFGRCLDLTDEQREEVGNIIESHKDSIAPLRESLRETMWELRVAVMADEVDPDGIRAITYEMAECKADLAIAMAGIKSEVRDILTEEQLDKLEELKAKRYERFEKAYDRLGQRLQCFE